MVARPGARERIAGLPRKAILETKRRTLLERRHLWGFLFEDEQRVFRRPCCPVGRRGLKERRSCLRSRWASGPASGRSATRLGCAARRRPQGGEHQHRDRDGEVATVAAKLPTPLSRSDRPGRQGRKSAVSSTGVGQHRQHQHPGGDVELVCERGPSRAQRVGLGRQREAGHGGHQANATGLAFSWSQRGLPVRRSAESGSEAPAMKPATQANAWSARTSEFVEIRSVGGARGVGDAGDRAASGRAASPRR